MKLSIIIPTFNSGAVLSRALNSIVSQTFTDFEVLIMDGMSTDNTIEVAQSYNNPRIHIFSEPDKGIYDAMNKGIKKASGEWLYFLGSDDWLLNPNILQSFFQLNSIDDFDVVYGEVEAPHLDIKHRGEWSIEKINYNRCHQAILYKRRLFKKNGPYNTSYNILADYVFNLKWFLQGKTKSKHIDMTIAHYSENGISERCPDVHFEHDYPLLLLKYGHKSIPAIKKKEIAKQAIYLNTDKPWLVLLLNTYVYWLRGLESIKKRL